MKLWAITQEDARSGTRCPASGQFRDGIDSSEGVEAYEQYVAKWFFEMFISMLLLSLRYLCILLLACIFKLFPEVAIVSCRLYKG